MDDKIYEALESELEKYQIEEEVEDILLSMSETLADMGITDKEITCRNKAGKTVLEICGICSFVEEGEETEVYVRWLKIGERQFEIEDYLL